MGSAWVACLGRCACGHDIRLNGHRTSSERNTSIFIESTIGVRFRPPPLALPNARSGCAVAIRVDGEAGAGGPRVQHFRIRDVGEQPVPAAEPSRRTHAHGVALRAARCRWHRLC